VGISLSESLQRLGVAQPDIHHTYSTPTALESFLTRTIPDLETSGLVILTWEPIARAFPAQARAVLETVHRFVQRSQASLVTQGASGRRWLRNLVHNYANFRPLRFSSVRRSISAIVVAGSGPSLEQSAEAIRDHREHIAVFATASAVDPLLAHGIVPDLAAVTDASVFAGLQLRAAVHRAIPVAAGLSATRALSSLAGVLPLNEGTELEDMIYANSRIARFPPAGTITSTLLSLARTVTTAPVICAGVDLGWTDGRAHARPHANETFVDSRVDRLAPVRSVELHAGHGFSQPPDLEAYASTMVRHVQTNLSPAFVLNPTSAWPAGLRISTDEFKSLPIDHTVAGLEPDPAAPIRDRRVAIATAALNAAIARVRAGDDEALRDYGTRLALPQMLRSMRNDDAQAKREAHDSVLRELESARALLE
jgi:hypothetical protein